VINSEIILPYFSVFSSLFSDSIHKPPALPVRI